MFHSSPRVPRVPQQARSPRSIPLIREPVCNKSRDLVLRDYLEHLGSPRALGVWMRYRYGEHRQLVELTSDPRNYNTAYDFARDHAATKFFSKCVGLRTGIDTEKVALASAEEAEGKCLETNRALRERRSGVRSPGSEGVIWFNAAAKIRAILGDSPPRLFGDGRDVEPSGPYSRLRSFRDVGWSTGRTTSSWGATVSSLHKYSSRPDVTFSARRYAAQFLRDSPVWGAAVLNADGPCSVLSKGLNVVPGNVMLIVPKNAKTGRVICYEPTLNIRLQLCVGQFIRERLAKHGVNLNDQSINQARAKVASLTGCYATLDLKSASDTLALELVWELLPFDWACLLDDLRSKYTTWPDGSVRLNNKFSSMGNGFTFELEALIFYALAMAVCEDVSVYGDDIIVPTESYGDVCHALEVSGFVVNLTKSFSDGLFRESCGYDAFAGFPVTPVYLRRLPQTTEDVIKLHNQLFLPWKRYSPHEDDAIRLGRKWRDIYPCSVGPRFDAAGHQLSDGHYHVDFDAACPTRATGWIDGWRFSTYIRLYEDHTYGSDHLAGGIPAELGFGALCAGVGPKRSWSVSDSFLDRKRYKYKKAWGLASFTWPSVWGS